MATIKKKVLAVVYNNMTFMDFNGPHTAMILTQDPQNPLQSFYNVETVALKGNKTSIVSDENLHLVADYTFQNVPQKRYDILLIPGGTGTRSLVNDMEFISELKTLCGQCDLVLTVCTGAALLAKTGLLDGKEATSNKIHFEFVKSQGPKVKWIKEKRWVESVSVLTSGGVSAGIDAGLYLVSKQFGRDVAVNSAARMEYNWNEDPDDCIVKA
jgi:transcriptional regulator GlxA family with amidase domain